MASQLLKIHPSDNVIVALRDLPVNADVAWAGSHYSLPYGVSAKHKFVTEDIETGGAIIMYGVLVGRASQPIRKGEPITTFNLKHDSQDYSTANRQPYSYVQPDVSKWQGRTFKGYHREDGRVGTYNYWLVVPLVFCENRNVLIMKDAFERELGYAQTDIYREHVRDFLHLYQSGDLRTIKSMEAFTEREPVRRKPERPFKNVDGIKFLTHEGGCGGTRTDANTLCALFAAYAVHPNVAGITVLSLGCQNSELKTLEDEIKKRDPNFNKPFFAFEHQKGTEYSLMSGAIKETFMGVTKINEFERSDAPLSKLSVGLKCGGSDGFSGISANPVLGHLSDIVVGLGGQTLLAEFPELNGVEQELINRCVTEEKAAKFEKLMRDYAGKAEAVGSAFAFNPSPGNIKDGLITDAIKSAGAARKGGNAYISDVLNYTERATESGLQLVCTPGNDVEATTGQTAAGANIILFTTGLGTPTGNPICPVAKVATNTILANRMPDVIDFDCGPVVDGTQSLEQNAEALLEYVIRVASGEQTKAQQLGQDDFIPWKRGVSL
ncbi:altronate dehydratase family protein [Dyadobacter chenwenxiniae]|uniref:Altronate dehydratase family protein n=1 Tax=Dyadobacter chenwenxiniae TaxID=2906456 RepID=A0A9X1TML0_9BACT|nr:altronate dehydratase family protein [Dyadobacter chenwenxiniae]MCF0063643.1 altronate dehydratase family protein [Dyadobacter chenwenxiniae]UON83319.1 altronate dehydratase family protein [Dyadobacter chenwenxiniae]